MISDTSQCYETVLKALGKRMRQYTFILMFKVNSRLDNILKTLFTSTVTLLLTFHLIFFNVKNHRMDDQSSLKVNTYYTYTNVNDGTRRDEKLLVIQYCTSCYIVDDIVHFTEHTYASERT